MNEKAFFTVITKSYLAYARVMALQLRKFHPGDVYYVFLVDNADGYFSLEVEAFRIIHLEDFLPTEYREKMLGYYTAFELCNALKPFAHLYLANAGLCERWIYLDSDIFVNGSLAPLFDKLDGFSILLTPHILLPGSLRTTGKLEIDFMRNGIYNGGFVGIRNTPQAVLFLEWWKERLISLCLHESPPLEVDQSWLNFVPSLFPGFLLIVDPGINVAYWNIHERPMRHDTDGRLYTAGNAIPFVHFSGWAWEHPDIPTKHYNVDLGTSKEAWLHAARSYSSLLRESGVETCSQWPYSFARAKSGQILTPSMRRNYWNHVRHQEESASLSSLFDAPEMFEDPAPRKESIWRATRSWLGAVKRILFG